MKAQNQIPNTLAHVALEQIYRCLKIAIADDFRAFYGHQQLLMTLVEARFAFHHYPLRQPVQL